MSFSAEVKEELGRLYPGKACCRRAELMGLVRAVGALRLSSGRAEVLVSTESGVVARKAFRLMKDVLPRRPELVVSRLSRLRNANTYTVTVEVTDLRFSEGFEGLLGYPSGRAEEMKRCCAKTFLRGFFLGSGSVLSPFAGHHLEMVVRQDGQAEGLAKLMAGLGVLAHITRRRQDQVVYLKDSDNIVRFLNVVGAHGALLHYENVRALREVKNRVNRLVNMETANLSKTVSAAMRQAEDIGLIQATIGLGALPPALRGIALARLKEPHATLQELAEMMEPPITKSAANHRMRRIQVLARRLRMDSTAFHPSEEKSSEQTGERNDEDGMYPPGGE